MEFLGAEVSFLRLEGETDRDDSKELNATHVLLSNTYYTIKKSVISARKEGYNCYEDEEVSYATMNQCFELHLLESSNCTFPWDMLVEKPEEKVINKS